MKIRSSAGILIAIGLGCCIVFAGILGNGAPERPRLLFLQASPGAGEKKASPEIQKQLMILEITSGTWRPHRLSPSFASSEDGAFSRDGKTVLFVGRRQPGESGQIYEAATDHSGLQQVTHGPEVHAGPRYLADGQTLCLEKGPGGTSDLFRSRPGHPSLERLTFARSHLASPTVLQDGRILFARTGGGSEPGLYLIRPDGTSFSVFFSKGWADRISEQWQALLPADAGPAAGKSAKVIPAAVQPPEHPQYPLQLDSGDVAFFGPVGTKGFCRISFDYPFTTRKSLGTDYSGHFHSGAVLPSGKLAVSYRPPGAATYGLYEFDPAADRLGNVLVDNPDWDELAPVASHPGVRPPALPSLVNFSKKNGRIYCLNAAGIASESGEDGPQSPGEAQVAVYRLRRHGEPTLLSRQPLRSDGSFLLEVPADTPFRIETLSAEGKPVARCATLWVRPNESRGCIGCHSAPNLAPDNLFLQTLSPSLPKGRGHIARRGN